MASFHTGARPCELNGFYHLSSPVEASPIAVDYGPTRVVIDGELADIKLSRKARPEAVALAVQRLQRCPPFPTPRAIPSRSSSSSA